MGKCAGLEGALLAPGPTMPVPLLKRGDKLVGCLVSILPAGPPSQGAVSGTGQALQGDSLPDPAGRVGGERTGDSTGGGVLQLWVGGWERS
jgi:hypothetical protein